VTAAELSASWLLTYGAQSAVACALALLAGRLLVRSAAERTILWKWVLMAPLATAALWGMGGTSLYAPSSINVPGWMRSTRPLDGIPVRMQVESERIGNGPERRIERVDDPVSGAVTAVMLGFAGVVALVALIRLSARYRRLSNELSDRQAVSAETLGLDAEHCVSGDGSRVAFSWAHGCLSPAALLGRSICVGPSFLQLSPRQRRSVVAHEIAHLERRDPHWILIADFIGALTSYQPLNAVVARQLRRDAEFAADEAAIRLSGDARALAESLAVLAGPFDDSWRASVAVGYTGSPLMERVQRILATDSGQPPATRPHRLIGILVTVLSLLLVGIPSLSAAPAPALRPLPGSMIDVEVLTRTLIQ